MTAVEILGFVEVDGTDEPSTWVAKVRCNAPRVLLELYRNEIQLNTYV